MKSEFRFKRILKEAKLKNGDKILDLASADNLLLKYIKKKVEYTAIDYFETRKNYVIKDENVNRINHNLEKGLPEKIKKRNLMLFSYSNLLNILKTLERFYLNVKKY